MMMSTFAKRVTEKANGNDGVHVRRWICLGEIEMKLMVDVSFAFAFYSL